MARSGSRRRPVRQQAMRGNDLQMALRRIICGAAVLAGTGVALAYPVGPPLSLEKLTAEADLIFKGTTGSSQQVEDDWFKPYAGFVVLETPFRVISVLKGDAPGTALRFRHYEQDPRPQGRMFEPQHYHFRERPELHRLRQDAATRLVSSASSRHTTRPRRIRVYCCAPTISQ